MVLKLLLLLQRVKESEKIVCVSHICHSRWVRLQKPELKTGKAEERWNGLDSWMTMGHLLESRVCAVTGTVICSAYPPAVSPQNDDGTPLLRLLRQSTADSCCAAEEATCYASVRVLCTKACW